jgi:hypothetical protein
MTSGRVSNLIGATFSLLALGASPFALTASGFARAGFTAAALTAAGFAITGLGAGLLSFTVTFDVGGDGLAFEGGRATFLGAAVLWAAFLGVALPGRLAALLGFFEGI